MNARKMLAGAFIVMLGMGMTSFKEDDRNFQIYGVLSGRRGEQSQGNDYRKIRRYRCGHPLL